MSLSKTIWLELLKKGERLSVAELAEISSANKAVQQKIHERLREAGFVRRFDKSPDNNRVRYGVTPDCKIPVGLKIKDVEQVISSWKE